MKRIKIREIEPGDCAEVFSMGSQEKYFCGFWPIETIRRIPESQDAFSYVAEVDRELRGFVIGSYSASLGKVSVENLFVDKRYRTLLEDRDVIAGHLVKRAINYGAVKGANIFSGLVDSTNSSSKNLCEKRGMKFSERNYLWGILQYEN